MSKLYPLIFDPIFKEKIWGGRKLKTHLNKEIGSVAHCGESWELSAVPQNTSVVSNGRLKGKNINDLLEQYKERLVGKKNYQKYGNDFPLLIKFLDAQQDLSVQVHPDDKLAQERYGQGAQGKSEMWYVMDADPGATLITGFKEKLTKDEFQKRVEGAKLEPVLNKEAVRAGDVFYIPAGRIHTIGEGILIAEIQQTADITYRIYDFDRTDDEGNKRELHVEDALEALDFQVYDSYKASYEHHYNERVELVNSPYFTTNKWDLSESVVIDYESLDSFVILIGLDGKGKFTVDADDYILNKGDVYLIPAEINNLKFSPFKHCVFLEVYIQ
ncbi:MAG: type I phosphomannose isomerase catalytic subunit [Fulvivirga sp.]|nr:type I phosphomannose isomerase catalytic subunit [Fulvivirga sp.]